MYNLRIRIPRLDRALVRLALKILLALLMHERGAEYSPQPAFRGERHDFESGDAKGGCSMASEVGEEVE
jgi:hypothetical protein